MKRCTRIFLCIQVYTSFIFYAQHEPASTYTLQQPRNPHELTQTQPAIYLNLSVNSSSNTANDLHQKTAQTTDITELAGLNPYQSLCDTLKQNVTAYGQTYHPALEWITHHKIASTAFALSSVYIYLAGSIYALELQSSKSETWAQWKQHLTFEELLAIPPQQFQQELLFEIQSKYVDPLDPTNSLYSFIELKIALDYEINQVKQLIQLYNMISSCSALSLFFINHHTLEQAQERYRKLLFIHRTFIAWCTQYKIDQFIQK